MGMMSSLSTRCDGRTHKLTHTACTHYHILRHTHDISESRNMCVVAEFCACVINVVGYMQNAKTQRSCNTRKHYLTYMTTKSFLKYCCFRFWEIKHRSGGSFATNLVGKKTPLTSSGSNICGDMFRNDSATYPVSTSSKFNSNTTRH